MYLLYSKTDDDVDLIPARLALVRCTWTDISAVNYIKFLYNRYIIPGHKCGDYSVIESKPKSKCCTDEPKPKAKFRSKSCTAQLKPKSCTVTLKPKCTDKNSTETVVQNQAKILYLQTQAKMYRQTQAKCCTYTFKPKCTDKLQPKCSTYKLRTKCTDKLKPTCCTDA